LSELDRQFPSMLQESRRMGHGDFAAEPTACRKDQPVVFAIERIGQYRLYRSFSLRCFGIECGQKACIYAAARWRLRSDCIEYLRAVERTAELDGLRECRFVRSSRRLELRMDGGQAPQHAVD